MIADETTSVESRKIFKAKKKVVQQNKFITEEGEEIEFEGDDQEFVEEDVVSEGEEEEIVNEGQAQNNEDWEDVDSDMEDDEEEKGGKKVRFGKEVWNEKSQPLKEGEELVFDSSAYDMLHRSKVEWPCLSIDFVLKERVPGS